MTAAQQRARDARHALTRARFAMLCRASAACEERAEAASLAGLSLAGMNTLLYRRRGSTAWPMVEKGRA
jgi:hypothetical protein